ncbi:putative nuclease HARBI1 [Anastrepha ludens]|uniref:putative nuclease HARBI1 n=1 Tax=Anastrepha ludens TaxID=28586 RepID=UPI0023B1D082|nr:putative nuclease HARBI1 [Anastrepha ludens]
MSVSEESMIVSLFMSEQGELRRKREREEVDKVLKAIFADSSSSSEDSDSENEEHKECSNYETTLDLMSDIDFKSHMRVERKTVEYLIRRYSESSFVPSTSGGGRLRITFKKSVYMYIWYVINTVTFRQLASFFGVALSAAWLNVQRVTDFLISISQDHIKWPEGVYLKENIEKFLQKGRIPRVIGVIDCTHIAIKSPKEHDEIYLDRKGVCSIRIQAVVDANKKFIDVTCGKPGSFNHYRILQNSKLFQDAENHYKEMFSNSYFILGNSAYPSTKWLVPPFKNYENLNESQRKFNQLHSSTRMVVEKAFGLLKGRFRRLQKFTEQTDMQTITNIVVGACVLHNICISFDDFYDVNEVNEANTIVPEKDFEDPNLGRSLDMRQKLYNLLKRENII